MNCNVKKHPKDGLHLPRLLFLKSCVVEFQSYTGVDRITPTPSEEFSPTRYGRPPHQAPHGRPVSEMELRHAGAGGYPKHDKHLERIRIPPSNSVNTKSGSVEIGTLVCACKSGEEDSLCFGMRGCSLAGLLFGLINGIELQRVVSLVRSKCVCV